MTTIPGQERPPLWQRVPLTPKIMLLTILVGLLAWGVLDTFQSTTLKKTFDAYLSVRLEQSAQVARMKFDQHVEMYHEAVRVITSQINFQNDIHRPARFPEGDGPVRYHDEIPPWLPDSSIMRHFVPIRFALLIAPDGTVREVYKGWPEPLPPSLLHPSDLLRELSHNQSYMTTVDGKPYLITAETIRDAAQAPLATLMLAEPIDNDFLLSSQGIASQDDIVALVNTDDHTILATNQSALVPVGSPLDAVQRQYLITGKSFFDWGASDLTVQFISLIAVKQFNEIGQSILWTGRIQRAVTGVVLIICFVLITWLITAHIKRLTVTITDFSREVLGSKGVTISQGDELIVLDNHFRRLTGEIIEARELLQRQAKELLREKTVYLDNIMHSSPLAIVATDLDLRIKYCNRLAGEFFGHRHDALLGKTVMEIQVDDHSDPARFAEAMARVRQGNSHLFTVTRRTEGGELCLETRISGVWDKAGELVGFVLMVADITERRRSEEKIKFMARFPSENPNPVLRISSAGVLLFANPASEPLLAAWNFHGQEVLPAHVQETAIEVFSAGTGREQEQTAAERIYTLSYIPVAGSGYVNIYGMDITERTLAERRATVQYVAARILAESATLSQAVSQLLRAICENLGWEFGEMWNVDGASGLLRLDVCWHGAQMADEIEVSSRDLTFAKGEGLPGRAWESGQPAWIPNVLEDYNFFRHAVVSRAGLHGAFAFPLRSEGVVIGVMGFFGVTVQQPDQKLLAMFNALGTQIGDFIVRKQAEEALRQAKTRYSSLFENMLDGVAYCRMIYDDAGLPVDFLYLNVNSAFYRLTGLHEVTGKKASEVMPGLRENHPELLEIYGRVARTGKLEKFEIEFKPLQVWLSVSAYSTEQDHFAAVFDNITARKQAEMEIKIKQQQLEGLNRTLEQRVLAEVALNREKDQFLIQQSRQAAMGEMIGNIAHQWRQPLNTLGLLIQDLLHANKHHELSDAYLANSVHEGMAIVSYMSQTIDDFRNFFRPEKEKEPFLLREALDKAISFVEASFRNNNIAIALEARDGAEVVGYANGYAQVLLNILNNAKDALIERQVAKAEVRIRLFSEGERSVVTITDNAGGIQEDVLARIFDPYYTTKEQGMGTGIGLYMAKTIIEKNMRGKLSARNTGNGVEFRIEV